MLNRVEVIRKAANLCACFPDEGRTSVYNSEKLNTAIDELLFGIRTVVNGQNYVSNDLKNKSSEGSKKNPQLSEREKDVLQLLSKGLSSRLIAEQLFITEHTVNSHRKSLLKKFGCNTTAQMLHKLVMLDDDLG
ncbi:MAG: response regulator transcription factor [Flavobacteriales bacterium]